MPNPATMPSTTRILITAGPTHEPIDAVRFLGNRSSGRMGLALAAEAIRRGLETTLLLGPVQGVQLPPGVEVHRFTTCEDLRVLLKAHAPATDILIMAAAVADYRPALRTVLPNAKFRRGDGPKSIELEPTPDLIAQVAAGRRPGQFLVAFALEPADEVVSSAHAKLRRKGVDLVVGNPLQTMDSDAVEAVVVDPQGGEIRTPGTMHKREFAPWLMDLILARRGA